MKRFLAILFIIYASTAVNADPRVFRLESEPTIRIGLATNARVVTISTPDSQLTATVANEPSKMLAVNKISVSARAYRPPQIELYSLEIAKIETQSEAEQIAADVQAAIGEKTFVLFDAATKTWRVKIGDARVTPEEAADFKETLNEKGFGDAAINVERKPQPSTDAIELSKKSGHLQPIVGGANAATQPNGVLPVLDPNLREVVVSGVGNLAKFSSLKPISFASTNERSIPVRVNGKAYRGRIEVFVNERGTLTVVNVVKLEDYLRGVVPNELGFPALEAQKAQAVAARTYAVKNIGQFAAQGFDLLPTTRSQVYGGYSSESFDATRAVEETRGIVATFHGNPITAYYTSTCGGRTENVENIFGTNEPYLRGVECSLEGASYFDPFLIKSTREMPKIERDENVDLARQTAFLAVNNFSFPVRRFSDEYFKDAPTENELRGWLATVAARLNASAPVVSSETAKPANFAAVLATMLYGADYADTLLSASDVSYNLSFGDADKIPANQRANTAILLRDGWLSLYPDLTLRPEKPFSRARILNTILRLAEKKKWFVNALQTGAARTSEAGKLIVGTGKNAKTLNVRPDVFLFRYFGDAAFQVKETALVGGEIVSYHVNTAGEVDYLEVRPTLDVTTPERTSPLRVWNVNLSPAAVQSRLSRYVRGIGTLYDLRISRKGFSRRAIELEIVGSNGTRYLKGGAIRSALRLKEQLFVLNKRYGANGNVTSYSFTGRGWGHGVGMCQYGAFGLAKMGLKYDKIIKHYYTGVDLAKAY
jgi:stage II sporulation protein D